MGYERLGILGGTFDPTHFGHLILAEYSAEELGLDHVLFVPVGDHPQKLSDVREKLPDRMAMLQLAIADNSHFSISTVDIDRPGPHYSADTVKIIQSQYPESEIFFLMGGDNLRSLPTWKRAEELYGNCKLAVMRRSDEDISPDMHEDILPGLAEQVVMVDVPLLSIWLSSTHIIERIEEHKSIRYLVPDAVIEYIHEHNLYRIHD